MTAAVPCLRNIHPLALGLPVETCLLLLSTASHIPTHIPALKNQALIPRHLSIYLTTKTEVIKGV